MLQLKKMFPVLTLFLSRSGCKYILLILVCTDNFLVEMSRGSLTSVKVLALLQDLSGDDSGDDVTQSDNDNP